ncbi:AraC family transcriptional regulator [Paenibacillus sp. PDC88]|uniref:AraC family transcriptional regulator n=1 Tax=Paenibacillus sp. PDC88 TaxID=1884375 RepID=UPI00089B218A|nr:AraC family transcriptional regulator [Paenibacillus sp. PDC88]SDX04203.1 Helix-turn-helix domain-containing protein [Paenibacillus sp. PDC88]
MRKYPSSKGKYYRKTLLVILFAASIPGLLASLGIYWFAAGAIKDDMTELHRKQMEERAAGMDDLLGYLEQSIASWSLESSFGEDLKNMDFSLPANSNEMRNISQVLHIIHGSHPLISQVQLYIQHENEPYLFNPQLTYLHEPKLQHEYENLLTRPERFMWSTQPTVLRGASQEGPAKKEPVIMLSHKIIGADGGSFGVLMVTLVPEKLLDQLMALTPYNEGSVFLLDENMKPMVSSNDGVEAEVFERSLREDILKTGQPSGSSIKEWRGVTYSVSYNTFDRLGEQWTYVAAAPMSVITSSVELISTIIFTISLLMLLAALFLSWIASRHIYSPVEQFVTLLRGNRQLESPGYAIDEFKLFEQEWQEISLESKALQLRLEEELPRIKESFLLQLVQGHLQAYSEKDIRERMKHYGWNVSDRKFTFIIVQLTGQSGTPSRFDIGEEGLAAFAAANIIEDTARDHLLQYSVLSFHNLMIGVLVIQPLEEVQQNGLQSFAEALTAAVSGTLRLAVTVTISQPTTLVRSLPNLFIEVNQAASLRLFRDENQIIDMNQEYVQWDEHAESGKNTNYPFALDREMTEAMRMGEQEKMELLVDEFLGEVSAGHEKEYWVQQCVLQLYGSMQYVILQTGIQPHQLFKGKNMYEQLSIIREPRMLSQWLKACVIHPYMEHLKKRTNIQMKRMVEETIRYVHLHYMHDISLDSCAHKVGTTPYTLSRLFKQVTGVNFVDYLTDYRVVRAKELLRTTNLKIHEIAEGVGYKHSYFNRIFKKYEGMTPSEYRDEWRAG